MGIKILTIICACTFMSFMMSAQVKDSIPDLPADEVEVIKNFELKATELNPIFQSPKLSEIEKESYKFDYNFNIPSVDFEPPKPQIRPLAYSKPIDKQIYDGFIDLSFGTPTSPKAAAGYNYHVEDWFEFGVLADYFSANDGDAAFRDFDKTNLKMFAGYNFTKAIRLDVTTDYQADNFNLYGSGDAPIAEAAYDRFDFSPSITFDWFNKSKTLIKLGTNYSVTDLNPLSNKESIYSVDLDWNQGIGNKSMFAIDGKFSHYRFDSLATYDLIQVSPSYHINQSNFNLEIGGSINSFTNDSLKILPEVNLQYHLDENMNILAGVKSEYLLYDLNRQYAQNQFMTFDSTNYFVNNSISPYLGATYSKGDHRIELKALYNLENNLPVWNRNLITSALELNQIAEIDYLSTEFRYQFNYKSSSVKLFNRYRFIDNPFVRKWHSSAAIGQTLIDDKLKLDLEYFSNDSRFFTTSLVEALHDLNFKAEMNLTQRFSVYAQVLNIFDREYEFIVDYPGFGRTFRGGVFVRL